MRGPTLTGWKPAASSRATSKGLGPHGEGHGLARCGAGEGRRGVGVGQQAAVPGKQGGELVLDEGPEARAQQDLGRARVAGLLQPEAERLPDGLGGKQR